VGSKKTGGGGLGDQFGIIAVFYEIDFFSFTLKLRHGFSVGIEGH
jgi:hypothetical protein